MNAMEEGGKAVNALVDAMKSAPLALALLTVNLGFIAFSGYILYEVSANARERNKTNAELINQLVKDCRHGP